MGATGILPSSARIAARRGPESDRWSALAESFGHVGKSYDFKFDVNVTTRLVCTDVVYRAYQGRGDVDFSLVKRVGRFTLSCDDLMDQFLSEEKSPSFDRFQGCSKIAARSQPFSNT